MSPRATYRIHFNGDFTFASAEAIVPYLDRLGISHVYASPVTKARSGSSHGYDVVDPTQVNPELGGECGLRSLVAALRTRNMGLIIDIVPNHMGVAGGENPWWNDVLENGPESPYARFFDIDWRDKLLLPVLGSPLSQALEDGHLKLEESGGEAALVLYDEHRLPIRAEDRNRANSKWADRLEHLLERQHYRLLWWRAADDELNWRRFFTINELAGLRIEDPDVFEATHQLVFRLYEEELIDGVRVDHVDGLTDPAGYCRALRRRLDALAQGRRGAGERPYIVVEKILGPGEQLATDWGVDGTTGYDFMEEVSALLHDPAGEGPLADLWSDFSGRRGSFAEEELQARRDMLSWAFQAQLSACVESFHELALSAPETHALTRSMLHRAIERLLWVFPVYRTYGTGTDAPERDAPVRERAGTEAKRLAHPGEGEIIDRVLTWLAGEGPGDTVLAAEAVRRFQQLSAPIAAKAVEDTAFYRYGRLLSRTDVGFDAGRFAMSVADFHRRCEARARDFPHAMLATATHDHKRGEDVRARLAVLSAIPELWRERVARLDALADGARSEVDPADRYMLYQTLFGAWREGLAPDDAAGLGRFGERVAAWQVKAVREAKLRSSWEASDEAYEAACTGLLKRLLDPARSGEFLSALTSFVGDTAAAAAANMLAQLALRCTVPGVPDLYQGTELPDFSLVDPDNRCLVDFAARESLLADASASPKLALLGVLLRMRRDHPQLFEQGGYEPLEVVGARADHVIAFCRTSAELTLLCVVAIRCGAVLHGHDTPVPDEGWWQDTRILCGGAAGEDIPIAEHLASSPVRVSLQGAER